MSVLQKPHSVVWLSHPLAADSPAYGDGERMQIENITQISAGATANTSRFILPNHLGTHVDAPRHFFENGSTLTEYSPEFWVFVNPLMIDVQCDDGYLISTQDVDEKLTVETDLLLIRTGFEKFRKSTRYWKSNPGLDPKLGTWLRSNFPTVRAVGMDFISVTSLEHKDEGRAAHRTLLDPNGPGAPVLAIEDMSLSKVDARLETVIIAPLRVLGADGGQCTVIGFVT
jgi:arylformamidase